MTTCIEQTETATLADRITAIFAETFTALIELRDRRYFEQTVALDREKESLERERTEITEAAQNLAELLPARVRVAQAQHDRLLVAGDREGAAVKLAEQKEAEAAPARMSERQAEISARIDRIESEKRSIGKDVFQEWFAELQPVVRAGEHGLFIELLDGLERRTYQFQEQTGVRVVDVLGNVLHALTAPERSEEWASGNRWYGGRR